MTWQTDYYPFVRFGRTSEEGRTSPFRINEQCFIRKEHKCSKIFGASKSCFIACPTDDELEPILELMSEKLMKVGIEPIIAVKERAYGQDIFCTKICGKIIESRFCIVILNDTVADKQNIPNPNVYYEYGLMTSLGKHVVPLQKEDLELAFNIQSYDTIKYSSRNIGSELDRAFKDAIRITESKEKEDRQVSLPHKTLLRKLELAGLELKDDNWILHDAISDTLFKGFAQYQQNFYAYIGKIDDNEEFQTYLEDTDVVLYRTEKRHEGLKDELNLLKEKKESITAEQQRIEQEGAIIGRRAGSPYRLGFDRELRDIETKIDDIQRKLSHMTTMFVGFVVNPQLDSDDFKKKVEQMIGQYQRYHLAVSTKDSITLGDLNVPLEPASF